MLSSVVSGEEGIGSQPSVIRGKFHATLAALFKWFFRIGFQEVK
jgi:hypothetical protein